VPLSPQAYAGQRDFRREFAAALAKGLHFDRPADDWATAGLEKLREVLPEVGSRRERDDKLVEVLPEGLGARITEYALCRRIPEANLALDIHHQDGVVRRRRH